MNLQEKNRVRSGTSTMQAADLPGFLVPKIRHSMLLNSNTFKSCGKYIIIHNQLKITIFMVGISTGFPTKNMNNIWPNKLLIAMAANHFTWGTFPSSLASSTFHYSNKKPYQQHFAPPTSHFYQFLRHFFQPFSHQSLQLWPS